MSNGRWSLIKSYVGKKKTTGYNFLFVKEERGKCKCSSISFYRLKRVMIKKLAFGMTLWYTTNQNTAIYGINVFSFSQICGWEDSGFLGPINTYQYITEVLWKQNEKIYSIFLWNKRLETKSWSTLMKSNNIIRTKCFLVVDILTLLQWKTYSGIYVKQKRGYGVKVVCVCWPRYMLLQTSLCSVGTWHDGQVLTLLFLYQQHCVLRSNYKKLFFVAMNVRGIWMEKIGYINFCVYVCR